jgi:hypothetical protein
MTGKKKIGAKLFSYYLFGSCFYLTQKVEGKQTRILNDWSAGFQFMFHDFLLEFIGLDS